MPAEAGPIISVVDDDSSVRRAVGRLLRAAGMDVRLFESELTFLDSDIRNESACLVADVKMPGLDGLELQRKLVERGAKLPVILITGYDTEETRSLAKQSGAAAYFRKPVDDRALPEAIRWSLSGGRTESDD